VAVLAATVPACATRAPHRQVADPPPALSIGTNRLISVWQRELGRFISRNGQADPTALSELRVARSRAVLRPARITFGVLDVEASAPGRDGWDLEGVLTGKQVIGDRSWYFFIVGVVARAGYRPSALADIRAVGVSAQNGTLSWRTSQEQPQAVQRYRETFGAAVPVQFPADTDTFALKILDRQVSIRELRSGAQWSLRLGTEAPI
jgi:hypothetical protein